MENTSASLSTRKRSVGVTILGYVIIISNTILLFEFVPGVDVFTSPLLSNVGLFIIFPFASLLFVTYQNFIIFSAITIIFGVASIICGYGVIRLKNIARIICIVGSIIRIVETGFIMVYASEPLIPSLVLAPLSIYIFFLTRPKVKEQFR